MTAYEAMEVYFKYATMQADKLGAPAMRELADASTALTDFFASVEERLTRLEAPKPTPAPGIPTKA